MLFSRRCVAGACRCAMLAVVLSAAGCASDRDYRREAYARDAYAARNATPPPRRAAVPEVEDDGLPSQVPPPANRRAEPDDPREPYSPNYGRAAATPQRAATFQAEPKPHIRRTATY